MNKHNTGSFFAIFSIVIFIAILQADVVQSATLSPVISCSKEEWLVAEPFVIQLSFTNNSGTNQIIDTFFGNGSSRTSYWVSRDGERFYSINAILSVDPGGQTTCLAPSESCYHDEILSYDSHADSPLLSTLGDYFLRVDYRGQKSNVIKIHVREAEAATDKKWVNAMKSRDVAIALMVPTWKTDEASKTLNDCVKEVSVYSHYAAFSLAAIEPNKTNALMLLDKSDVAGFPLRHKVVLEKGRINLELGEKAKANELFQRIANDFPNSAAASEVKRKNLLESSKP